MTARVPFRLTRRTTPAPAAAVLLTSAATAELAALVARLGREPSPHVFAVARGFLVVPEGDVPPALPGVVRLRRLAENLFVQADADLVPPLAPAEASDLTRQRGLVILPGCRALAFDPAKAVAVWSLIAAKPTRRDTWQPFPPRPKRAERLVAIHYEDPAAPLQILEQGKPDNAPPDADKADALRPPDAPLKERVAGRAGAGLGKFLAWLGGAFGSKRLAEAGRNMVRRAVERVPRLSEDLLGKQEAALQQLLKLFRSGDTERALRHALPVGSPGDARVVPGPDARLPDRVPHFSLADLLGGQGRGRTFAVWFGGSPDVWADLLAEYRRLARAAVERGDYRRAAYIHGVLLNDVRAAADALNAGGLFRDAATLYRDKLREYRLAAAAFEKADDLDEALRLYRHVGDHAAAGDLLRRAGDEEAAVGEYGLAADDLARGGYTLAAGDLMRDRALRPDLGANYYRAGWLRRPAGDSRSCAERLVERNVGLGQHEDLLALVGEAAAYYSAEDRTDDGPRFFNFIARTAERPALAALAGELRDRARLFLAGRLRADRPVTVAATFGREPAWPAPLVRDAEYAVRRLEDAPPVETTRAWTVRVVDGPVTAVAVARQTGDVVVAGGGSVVCWRAANGRVERVARTNRRVDELACDPRAEMVVAMERHGASGRLQSYVKSPLGAFQFKAERHVAGPDDFVPELLPEVQPGPGWRTFVQTTADELDALEGAMLLALRPMRLAHPGGCFARFSGGPVTVTWTGDRVLCEGADGSATTVRPPWYPRVVEGGWAGVRLDFRAGEAHVEFTGVNGQGAASWFAVDGVGGRVRVSTAYEPAPVYVAAALLGAEQVVGVTTGNEVRWLKVVGQALRPFAASRTLPVPSRAVAVCTRRASHDVAVIFEDGSAARVPLPS